MIPTEAQSAALEVIREAEKPVAWLGSIRAGKTVGACMALVERMENFPGHYVIGCYTYKNFDRNLQEPLTQHLKDCGYKYKLTKTYPYKLEVSKLKSTVWVFSANNATSQNSLQGMTARGALLDEVLLLPRNFIMQIVGRISMDHPMMLMTANKSSPSHWIKTEWIDKGKVIQINSSSDDNPHISEIARGWHRDLITGFYGESMLGNEWASEFNAIVADLNVVERLPKDSSLDRWFCVGYLTNALESALIRGVIKSGKIYFYDVEIGPMMEIQEKVAHEPTKSIVNITQLDTPYGVIAIAEDQKAWAESLTKHRDNVYILKDVYEDLSCLTSWVYKDRERPEDIASPALAVAMGVYHQTQRAKPFGLGRKLI